MTKSVTIRKLRRISDLTFEFPENRGCVYLLTGANGAGKSTLISTLAQIGNPGALDHFFQPNINFRDTENILSISQICYNAGDDLSADFYFSTEQNKWVCKGDSAAVFAAFGFAETLFAGAKPKRKPVPGELFETGDVRPADSEICKAAAEIFDDDIFQQLSVIQSPVTGEDVFLRPLNIHGKQYYFSENNFSAGERAVIKLSDQLLRLSRGSLVLIDEAEMALHPKAQKRLLLYLNKVAERKNLLVIISTQSASLIKITDPRRILFLDQDETVGKMVCRRNVYPAAILGEMAFAEEILPETILLVEDGEAAMLLEAIVAKLKSVMPGTDFPYTKILPVGGYMQVVILMDNLERVFPPFVHRRAVLDKDAEHNIRRTAADPGRSQHSVVSRNLERIYFLPCAPEQGVIRLLETSPRQHNIPLRKLFSSDAVDLMDVMRGNYHYREITGSSRSDCKDKLSILVSAIASISGEPEYLVRKKLYHYYIEKHYKNITRLKEEYCPLIFRRY